MPARRIHITGASGSGVTTLGRGLAARARLLCVDTDDHYWLPTEPPFQAKRPVPERLQSLSAVLDGAPGWVLSGSLMVWGDPLIPRFDLVIYLEAPAELRLARLRSRERRRFGSAIDEGGALHATHLAFLDWAAGYDSGAKGGRSRERHRAWLAALPCPVLELDGRDAPAALVDRAMDAVADDGL